MRTTISLPDPLLTSAKRKAKSRGVTLSVVMADALRGHLMGAQSGSAPPFQLHTVRGKPLPPRLDLDRTSALLIAEDEAGYKRR